MVGPEAKPAIHQFVSVLSYGDAISNHTIALREILRKCGHSSEIYVMESDKRVAAHCRHYLTYRDDPNDILVYQYGSSTPLTNYLASRLERTILYYHNITPPTYFQPFEPQVAQSLESARNELEGMVGKVRSAVTVSGYNRDELCAIGYQNVTVLPLLFDLPSLAESASTHQGRQIQRRYADGGVNILFVGRLAPNKCQDDLMRVLRYYRRLIDPCVRLLLVGSAASNRYQAYLEVLAEHMEVADAVHFIGQVETDKGFGGYYKAASVFLCLSEHEGFCVPLIEAMYCGAPVIAYASSAVPETMGGAGILVTEKRYDIIAELIQCVVSDTHLREQVTATQRARLTAFERNAAEARIIDWVSSLDR